MEILAFQAFIGFTIILTGFIAKKHLAAVCLAWTAFTFLAVFAAPLLILQLVTIWGCFALFNSGGTAEKGTAPTPSRETADKSTTIALSRDTKSQGNTNGPGLLQRAAVAAQQAAKALDDLNDDVTLQKEVQSATSELNLAIHAERALIESALKSSKRAREIEKQLEGNPVLKNYYDESKHKFEKIGRKIKDELESDEKGISSVLSAAALLKFDFPPRHTNPKIADAIETKISTLKKERDSFVSDAVKEIWADDRLLKKFEERLREVGASEIFARLCLESGKSAPQQLAAPAAPKSAVTPKSISQVGPQHLGTSNTPHSGGIVLRTLSEQVREARLNALANAHRKDEEDRKRQAEEAARCAEREAAETSQLAAIAARNHGSQPVNLPPGAVVHTITTQSSAIDPPDSPVTCAIKAQAEALRVPFLVHFTKVENLGSIIEHGLGSLTTLKKEGIRPLVNDHNRYDGYHNAICLSIAHPNDKMFFKYRAEKPDQDWAVLVLDRSILWTHPAAFCRFNAADRRMIGQPLLELMQASAFEAMFPPSDDLPSREEQNLKPFDPTDVQAEVLVFDRLPPGLINSVVFSSARAAERHKTCVGEKPISVHEGRGFLGARSYARKSGWTYSAAASPRTVQRQQWAPVEERLSALESGRIKLTDIPF